MNFTPNAKSIEELGNLVAEQVRGVIQRIGEEAGKEERTLEWFEKQTIVALKGIGQTLLAGLCELYVSAYPAPEINCGCGGIAKYQRKRGGQSKTLLGEIVVTRPYYLCESCKQGQYPLDKVLGFCAGGISSGLSELMALMGVEFPFEEAAKMLEKLTLVHVSPNACRKEAERLGNWIGEDE